MERELPPYRAAVTKPARPSIWPTLIVGAVLATVIGGGVYLLGQTRAKWEANRAGKAERAAAFERQWQQQQDAEVVQRVQADAKLEELRRAAIRNRDQPETLPEPLRCINGQLFRRIPGGWENLPDTDC
ncbi:hypothetical protein [Pseudoxanthomonas sp. PXM04]|uniref:hypothetical protein n=1 Tax=Pseudoxanthomonas sp. PXM04 TaxID=2769297 RepID=UPI00177FF776|nr:hypothetical protein [Pseudoxanthomonas sp. PXM04]MBD9377934.1 hypothetical protein [Pseudoxanthomonas sp. PXM04]MBD9377947.1 hypothetical protein [Pseudoxanthomonas sp. PXM04]